LRTLYTRIDGQNPNQSDIRRAARILALGGLVAFPTETVYGLGADAFNPQAVRRIFIAKGRPQDNPLIVHVARWEDVPPLVSRIPRGARQLALRFWPGPLTLILPAAPTLPSEVTAGLKTVAVRIPAHPVARELLLLAQTPVAAPSANLSGRPSPTTGLHVLKDLAGKIEMVLDAGPTRVGVESTVLDLTSSPPVILRPGGLAAEELAAQLGNLGPGAPSSGAEAPRSPGMKYTHYAPRAQVFLADGPEEKVVRELPREVERLKEQGLKVAVLTSRELGALYAWRVNPDLHLILGSRTNPAEAARLLFRALRYCDRRHADIILAETFPETGLGQALMNRLIKAAGGRKLWPDEF